MSGNGDIWIYRAHPVILPSRTTFNMQVNFGGGGPPPIEIGDWVTFPYEDDLLYERVARVEDIQTSTDEALYTVQVLLPNTEMRQLVEGSRIRKIEGVEALAALESGFVSSPKKAPSQEAKPDESLAVRVSLLGRYKGVVAIE